MAENQTPQLRLVALHTSYILEHTSCICFRLISTESGVDLIGSSLDALSMACDSSAGDIVDAPDLCGNMYCVIYEC